MSNGESESTRSSKLDSLKTTLHAKGSGTPSRVASVGRNDMLRNVVHVINRSRHDIATSIDCENILETQGNEYEARCGRTEL
jgi:hypothetical protein